MMMRSQLMAEIGLKSSIEDDFSRKIAELGAVIFAEQRPEYEGVLSDLIGLLGVASLESDAMLALDIERSCIAFERAFFVVSEDDVRRLDKQLFENDSARRSLEFVKDKDAYRRHVKQVRYPESIGEFIPEGEPYSVAAQRQIAYLGHAKKGIVSEKEKLFAQMRQKNIRAGLKNFQQLQAEALFLE